MTAKADIAAKEAALTASRYGAAVTSPTGAITDPGNFKVFGQWALNDAYHQVGVEVASIAAPFADMCPSGYLITNDADRHSTLLLAQIAKDKLDAFSIDLGRVAPPIGGARLAAIPAIMGIAGSVEALAGLFRADYKLSDASVAPDELATRVASAIELRATLARVAPAPARVPSVEGAAPPAPPQLPASVPVLVEGLDQRPGGGKIVDLYGSFTKALSEARSRYAAALALATSDQQKASLAADKAVLDSAAAFDSALTTPANGIVPLLVAANAYESRNVCAVFVKFSGFATSLVTRKRLLFRNDDITAISGGTVLVVFSDPTGTTRASKRVSLDRRIGGRLSSLVNSAVPLDTKSP